MLWAAFGLARPSKLMATPRFFEALRDEATALAQQQQQQQEQQQQQQGQEQWRAKEAVRDAATRLVGGRVTVVRVTGAAPDAATLQFVAEALGGGWHRPNPNQSAADSDSDRS